MRVDKTCVGVGDRVGPQVVLPDPRQSSVRECWDLWPHQWLEAHIACLGKLRGAHADIGRSSARAPCSLTWVKSEAKPVQVRTCNSSSGNSTRGNR